MSLLHLDSLMNRSLFRPEQWMAHTQLALTIGLLVGDALRDALFPTARGPCRRKWRRFSGLYVLLRERMPLSRKDRLRLLETVLLDFAALVCPTVRTHF